jgi:hypothetical protein
VEAERGQSCIVKGGGTGDIRDTDACMVDHGGVLRLSYTPRFFASNILSGTAHRSYLIKLRIEQKIIIAGCRNDVANETGARMNQ